MELVKGLKQSKLLKYGYYLILNIDTPWIKDDLRDRQYERLEMFKAHKLELDTLNVRFDIITGQNFNKRFHTAVDLINKNL